MTKSVAGKLLVGMVLMAGSAGMGQWQFQRESTLVPAGPDEVALGIQTLRVHAPVASSNAASVTVDILDIQQQVIGHLVDTKAAAPPARGNPPEELIVLSWQGRKIQVHFKDRSLEISDGATTVTASFDRASPNDPQGVDKFANELRLIAGIQAAAKSAIERSGSTPVARAGVLGGLGFDRIARVVPASWTSWMRGAPPKHDEAVCYTGPDHAKCAGGFGTSRSSACDYSQQEANNECAAASGYCIGCCAWVGSGCDCSCLYGDLACMCESCGGLCGPGVE